MDAVAQTYLDLFLEHRETIEAASSPLLNGARQTALEEYQRLGLPSAKQERFKRSDITKFFDYDFGINLNGVLFPLKDTRGFTCDLKEMSCTQAIMLNERFEQELATDLDQLPEGVFLGSLNYYLQLHPEKEQRLAKVYSRYAEPDTDGTVALNTMYAQDALLLYVPEHIKVEEPLRIIQLLRSDVPMLLFRRILIVVEEGAEVEVLFCNHTLDRHLFLVDQVVEVDVVQHAKLRLYDVEEASSQTRHISTLSLRQDAFSEVLITGFTLNNGWTRNNYWTRFLGPHAKLTLGGLAIGTHEQHIDNFTYVSHIHPECETNELFKYIMDDEAVGAFEGRVFVSSSAQKTNAQQSNRNLILSPKARVYSKPQLEIYADDVKCSHGMTTGQLDEDALFYMQQRGVSLDDARTLLSIAFTDDVISLVALEPLRNTIVDVIAARFNDQEVRHCNSCGKICF